MMQLSTQDPTSASPFFARPQVLGRGADGTADGTYLRLNPAGALRTARTVIVQYTMLGLEIPCPLAPPVSPVVALSLSTVAPALIQATLLASCLAGLPARCVLGRVRGYLMVVPGAHTSSHPSRPEWEWQRP